MKCELEAGLRLPKMPCLQAGEDVKVYGYRKVEGANRPDRPMDLRQVLGRNVRTLRAAQGLSQEEVAHRSSIHVTYLSGVENGRRNPTILVLDRLAAALETTAAKLIDPQSQGR